jgi:GNAT superfamily N-acetyltransferase
VWLLKVRPEGISTNLLRLGVGVQMLIWVLTALLWGRWQGQIAIPTPTSSAQALGPANWQLYQTLHHTHWIRVGLITVYWILAVWLAWKAIERNSKVRQGFRMSFIEIIQAQPEEADRLKQIAITSKSYWSYSNQAILDWANTPIITPEEISADMVYLARVDSTVVGWYRLKILLPAVTLEDLWVLPDYIGRGIGRKLFEHAVGIAKRSGGQYLELEADPNAEPFYTRMGCKKVGESISEWGRIIPCMRYDLQD